MKVGDLVELSAYGKKIEGFKWLRNHHGFITERIKGPDLMFRVYWFGKPECVLSRKDLKHVK